MKTPFLFVDPYDRNALICPLCGADTTHVDEAYVAGRDVEDAPVTEVRIDSRAKLHHETIPITWGRRQSIGVRGYCENGGHRVVIEFMQHKGATLMEIRANGDEYE